MVQEAASNVTAEPSTFLEQQIAKHPARYSDVAKCAFQRKAGLRAAIWPNRLLRISTVDNGAFIRWGNRVMEEFVGTPLARPVLAYAY